MMFPTGAPDGLGYEPGLARLRDYWLGGSHHSERDRVGAERILVVAPQLPYLVRQKHRLQQRMVRYLIDRGPPPRNLAQRVKHGIVQHLVLLSLLLKPCIHRSLTPHCRNRSRRRRINLTSKTTQRAGTDKAHRREEYDGCASRGERARKDSIVQGPCLIPNADHVTGQKPLPS